MVWLKVKLLFLLENFGKLNNYRFEFVFVCFLKQNMENPIIFGLSFEFLLFAFEKLRKSVISKSNMDFCFFFSVFELGWVRLTISDFGFIVFDVRFNFEFPILIMVCRFRFSIPIRFPIVGFDCFRISIYAVRSFISRFSNYILFFDVDVDFDFDWLIFFISRTNNLVSLYVRFHF